MISVNSGSPSGSPSGVPNGLYWLPRAALGGSRVECAAGTVVNSLMDGHTYIGLGQLGSHSDQRCNNEASMLMRWD